jgi:hypothetical protein
MSDQTVPMDDKELLSGVMSDEPIQEAAATPEPEPVVERPRDEHGRFAPKAAAETPPEPIAQPVEQPEKEQGIPSWRLKEEAEARRAAEARLEEYNRKMWQRDQELEQLRRQLHQFQAPKPEPVDPFVDFNGAIKQATSPFEDRVASFESKMALRVSKAEATVEYGKQAVADMEAAIEKAMQSGSPEMQTLAVQMQRSDHPVGVAMKWFQNHQLLETTGGDIKAYEAKLLENDEFLGRAVEAARLRAGNGQKPAPNIQLPPSLNKATASLSREAADNDMSDAALWRV